MSFKYLWFFCLSLSSISTATFRPAPVFAGEFGPGNGGDSAVLEFVGTAYAIHSELLLKTWDDRRGVDPAALLQAIQQTKVVSSGSDGLELNGTVVDAINYPEARTIVLSRPRWEKLNNLVLKKSLVLHEYLGILKIDDSDYRISTALVFVPTVSPSRRDPESLTATKVYGELVVYPGSFEVSTARRPWSAWWLPVNSTYLFQSKDGKAPLEKYDRYATRVVSGADPSSSSAALYEKKNAYDPYALSWEGRGEAWALASLLEPEPVSPVQMGDIQFTVGDLKALLIKTYERHETLTSFGRPYHAGRGAEYDDIFPDQFHLVVQREMFEKKKAIILDKDPSIAKWYAPVWRAETQIEEDAFNPSVFHVYLKLHAADPWVRTYDDVGTIPMVLEYTYDLGGVRQADGSLLVRSGAWTKNGTVDSSRLDSMQYHPDFVMTLPDDLGPHRSFNPRVQNEVVRLILGNAGT